jgi:hypothetical protein
MYVMCMISHQLWFLDTLYVFGFLEFMHFQLEFGFYYLGSMGLNPSEQLHFGVTGSLSCGCVLEEIRWDYIYKLYIIIYYSSMYYNNE